MPKRKKRKEMKRNDKENEPQPKMKEMWYIFSHEYISSTSCIWWWNVGMGCPV